MAKNERKEGIMTDTAFVKKMKEKYDLKVQIVKAPKGWKQWSVMPDSSSSIRIVWARMKKVKK